MTEESFKIFLQKMGYSHEKIDNMLKDTSADFLLKRAAIKYISLTLEEAEAMANKLRLKYATSVSLIESGVATYEDLIE